MKIKNETVITKTIVQYKEEDYLRVNDGTYISCIGTETCYSSTITPRNNGKKDSSARTAIVTLQK